jgi:branched-chain amino acid aminotransferase
VSAPTPAARAQTVNAETVEAETAGAETAGAETAEAETAGAEAGTAKAESAGAETAEAQTAAPPPFGTVAAPSMVVSDARDGDFSAPEVVATTDLTLHPFAHVLHYGSACFEGMKAHRGHDGVVRLFRVDRHVARMRRSAQLLLLPPPPEELLREAIEAVVASNLDVTPEPPGALYVRPVLFGTEPNIGAAAAPSRDAKLVVVASPVGDYFAGGGRPLRLLIETELPRSTPQFGEAKAGANYVMALGVTRRAAAEHGVDQVLFAPGGSVQETGAANFLLLDDHRVVTRALDGSFLHGVTRDAVLTLARDLGYEVQERDIDVDELLSWQGEAALAGTAAVLAGVGTLVHQGREVSLGDATVGPNTARLREALVAVQQAQAPDRHGWTTPVG